MSISLKYEAFVRCIGLQSRTDFSLRESGVKVTCGMINKCYFR